MSNKTAQNTSPNKVPLWFTDEELNIIMQDIKVTKRTTTNTFIILKNKIEDEIDRRKKLLKSLGGDE
jgi:hypothetical protein